MQWHLLGEAVRGRKWVMHPDLLPTPPLGFPEGNADYHLAKTAGSGDPTANPAVRNEVPPEGSAPTATPDRVLIDAVLAGDAIQFEGLVLRYSSWVYRFILKNVGSTAIAEDLTQETFVEAYRKLATFKAEAKFSTLLFGIALNRLRNHLNRSPDHRNDHLSTEILYLTIASESNPSHSLEKKQRLLMLQRAITGLSTELREVITLVALEELSYEAAAHIIGIPVGTVKSRMHRARSLLRESIASALER
jgi:RNA polymerase sigma-70 factor (ECF subfamily)